MLSRIGSDSLIHNSLGPRTGPLIDGLDAGTTPVPIKTAKPAPITVPVVAKAVPTTQTFPSYTSSGAPTTVGTGTTRIAAGAVNTASPESAGTSGTATSSPTSNAKSISALPGSIQATTGQPSVTPTQRQNTGSVAPGSMLVAALPQQPPDTPGFNGTPPTIPNGTPLAPAQPGQPTLVDVGNNMYVNPTSSNGVYQVYQVYNNTLYSVGNLSYYDASPALQQQGQISGTIFETGVDLTGIGEAIPGASTVIGQIGEAYGSDPTNLPPSGWYFSYTGPGRTDTGNPNSPSSSTADVFTTNGTPGSSYMSAAPDPDLPTSYMPSYLGDGSSLTNSNLTSFLQNNTPGSSSSSGSSSLGSAYDVLQSIPDSSGSSNGSGGSNSLQNAYNALQSMPTPNPAPSPNGPGAGGGNAYSYENAPGQISGSAGAWDDQYAADWSQRTN